MFEDVYTKIKSVISHETIECPRCKTSVLINRMKKNHMVCPECSHHLRMDARSRIAFIVDKNSFLELFSGLNSKDFFRFPGYAEKLEKAKQSEKNAKDMSESLLNADESDELKTFKKVFYKYGLNKYYKSKSKEFFEVLYQKVKENEKAGDEETLSKLSEIFILPFLLNIDDYEFKRMQHMATINYYEDYYSIYSPRLLSDKIKLMYKYIKTL